MKLLNILAVTAIGTLFAVGCSSTTTITSDAGDTGTTSDTGKTDTGTATDTGTTTDTGGTTDSGDPLKACEDCVRSTCSAEVTACSASTAKQAECKALVDCLVGCGADSTCQNKCISDNMSAEAANYVECVYARKATDMPPGCQEKCTSGG